MSTKEKVLLVLGLLAAGALVVILYIFSLYGTYT